MAHKTKAEQFESKKVHKTYGTKPHHPQPYKRERYKSVSKRLLVQKGDDNE